MICTMSGNALEVCVTILDWKICKILWLVCVENSGEGENVLDSWGRLRFKERKCTKPGLVE